MTENIDTRKKDILEKAAIVQRDRKTYAIAPHLPAGLLDKETLLRYAALFDRYDIQAMKITGAHRIAIIGFDESQLDQVWAELGMKPGAAIGLCVRSIEICPGTTFCKIGQQDSVALGLKIDEKYHGMELPGKFKFAVAGCPMNCAAAPIRDIGLQGSPRGWRIFVGGNLGPMPRMGMLLCADKTSEQALDIVDRIVNYFKKNAKPRDRLGRLIERIGWESFREEIMGQED